MSTSFAPMTGAAESWSGALDHDALRATLRAARDVARRVGHRVLASYSAPVDLPDALGAYRTALTIGVDQSAYWEQSEQRMALVGIGATATIDAPLVAPFQATSAAWDDLLAGAVTRAAPEIAPDLAGPLALGGYAFDPQAPRSPRWQSFAAGWLIAPELLLRVSGPDASLTITALIDDSTNCDASARRLSDLARRWASVALAPFPRSPRQSLQTQDLRPAEAWRQTVADATQAIQCGAFRKVVLARGVETVADAPFDVADALDRLRQQYPAATIFAFQQRGHYFVGASPERLARVAGGQVQTMALAGSAPRGATPAEDQALGAELLGSEKNNGEHAIVAETIAHALEPLCSAVWVDPAPHLLKLANVQHLRTAITGELRPGATIFAALAALHPTPAVGGFPREAALDTIRALEGLDRGWYAGPVGWVAPDGSGDFAVALRCGLIAGDRATLFAGCGIVAESDPAAEYAESALKLRPMLRALGGEE